MTFDPDRPFEGAYGSADESDFRKTLPYVPPDGPVPCDLVVCGEGPWDEEVRQGRGFVGPSGQILWGEKYDLISRILDRPRETVYVTNVCKYPCSDRKWQALSNKEREKDQNSLLTELIRVRPRLVLAFGRRASVTLIEDFTSIVTESGHAVLVRDGYIVMPLWHPAAWLRGNADVFDEIVKGLVTARAILDDSELDLVEVADVLFKDAWRVEPIKPEKKRKPKGEQLNLLETMR